MSSFVLEVPLRNLRPSVIYSVPCDRIVQRAYSTMTAMTARLLELRQLGSRNIICCFQTTQVRLFHPLVVSIKETKMVTPAAETSPSKWH